MNYFTRKSSARESHPSQQPSSANPALPRSSNRPRHSVAVSSLSNYSNRNPFRNSDLNRNQGIPSSRSYGHVSSGLQDSNELPSKRSISTSYVSRPAQYQGLPRSSTTFGGRGRPLANVPPSPEKPKSGLQAIRSSISRKLNLSGYLDWPSDKWMEALEYFDLMDFDELGYTFGFCLNGVHLVIRIISALENARRNLVNSRNNRLNSQLVGEKLNQVRQMAKKKYSFGWLELMSVLSLCMCLYSCYNAYKLFSARKSYQMHMREDPINSPNATLVQSPTAPQEEPQSWARGALNLISRTSSLLIGWPNSSMSHIPKPTQVHQLDLWNPEEVRMKIFTVYPPPQAFLLHFASLSQNCMNWALLMAATIFQTYWIVKFYSQFVKDKMIIQSEVMHEYNSKFVYPKAFPHTKEAATMTSSAEYIRREEWMSY
ncbi:hypothetical protein O181_075854 [Austropuccinia psidii MF-1]|uniref:Uncharacterized protein n=1 Tax=Austropuccinia psidii MF-1 TaxID=1389203 RepID=A0A9Q3IEV5_9BASI|nr:hypothetical protein [Austropuccinia psidii MF-1]